MKRTKKMMKFLALMSLFILALSGCSKKDQGDASLLIEIPAIKKSSSHSMIAASFGGSGRHALTDTTAPYAPIDVSGFDCILVNVIGPGIGEWDSNQTRVGDGSNYSYIGTFSKLIPVATGGTVEVKIKKGTKRFIQLLGVRSTVGCPSSVTSSELNSVDKFPGIFIVGNVQKDIIKDEQVNIASSYNYQEAVDVRGSEDQPVPTNADTTAPSIGAGTILAPSRTTTTVGLTWDLASDNATLTAQLKYKVVYSTVLAQLNSIENANSATLGVDWTANIASATVTGLTINTTYYFAVLVKDAIGNMALYTPVSKTTAAAGYTVSYNGNGNTGGSVPEDNDTYNNTATVTVLGNTGSLVKTGYKFDGWNTAANGSGTAYVAGSTFSIAAADVTLYAQWVSVYTITYNGNGNTGGSVPTDSNTYLDGQTATVLTNSGSLVNAGKTFGGWNTNAAGSGTDYAVGSSLTISASNITLYAKWITGSVYTVTYNGNGNTSGSVPVDSNSYSAATTTTVTVLGNTGGLAKTESAFSGWNTASDGSGTSYSADQTFTISANTTLYAQWSTGFSVTYDANGATGGSVPVDSNTYTSSGSATVLGNSGTLIKTNAAFVGWNTQADGNGTNYFQDDIISFSGASVTLYAKWIAGTTYTVTYNSNGSTSGAVPTDSNLYIKDQSVSVLGSNTLAKTNARFLGWSTSSSATTPDYVVGDTFAMGSANVNLYAVWQATEANKFYVAYNGNGASSGSVPIDITGYANGDTVSVLDNEGGLSKAGFTFSGWNTNASGTGTNYDTVSSDVAPTFSISANITLYAKWTVATTYSITYNANGATGSAPTDSRTYLDGQSATILGNTTGMTNGAKTFAGWNTAADGSGDAYATGETLLMSGATTLYAVWSDSYTISYNKNTTTGSPTGTAPSDSNTYVTGEIATLKTQGDLANTGYTFLGWNTASDGTGDGYEAGQKIEIGSASLTLYAMWAQNYYVATSGSDAGSNNCKTSGSPCKTIKAALDSIGTNKKGSQILVGSGTYTITASLAMKTNVFLLGGYKSSDWSRDIAANVTTISYSDTAGTNKAINVASLSGYQKIEGFTIQLSSGGNKVYYGIYISSSPNTMVRTNKIKFANTSATSGSGTYGGIYITGKYISDITGNVIDGNNNGTVGKYTYGIQTKSLSSGSRFNVINNVINVGMKPTVSASYAQGIELGSSNKIVVTVRNNTIYAGAAAAGNATATYGIGVKKSLKSSGFAKVKLYFDNNIVFAPTGQSGQYTYGLYCYSSFYCNVQSMKNNNFFTLKTMVKLGTSYSSVSALELAKAAATGNINIEMVTNGYFTNAGSKDFTLDTSCPSDIMYGGLDGSATGLNWGYETDLLNTTRTGNGTDDWSIGAYEKDNGPG